MRGKRRDSNEPEIIAAAEGLGATVFQLDHPVDLLIAFRGHNLLVEVKSEGGEIKSKAQKSYWSKPWPGPRFIVYHPQELMEILTNLPDIGDNYEWGTPPPLTLRNS